MIFSCFSYKLLKKHTQNTLRDKKKKKKLLKGFEYSKYFYVQFSNAFLPVQLKINTKNTPILPLIENLTHCFSLTIFVGQCRF